MDKTEEAKLAKLIEQELLAFNGDFYTIEEYDHEETGETVRETHEVTPLKVAEVVMDRILARYRLELKETSCPHGETPETCYHCSEMEALKG